MNLLNLSFIISILGIFLLLIISYNYEPKIIEIKNINYNYLNKIVKIQGTINSIKNYDEFQILTIKDSEEIDVLVEKNNLRNKEFEKAQILIVTGRVNQYKDYPQIIANKIEDLEESWKKESRGN